MIPLQVTEFRDCRQKRELVAGRLSEVPRCRVLTLNSVDGDIDDIDSEKQRDARNESSVSSR